MSGHHELATVLTRLQAVDFAQAASVTLLAYDWLICLPEEIEYVWRARRWNVATLLYLFSRYSPFVDTPLTLIYYAAPRISETMCIRMYRAASISSMIGTATSEMILGLRTFALYNCSRRVLWFLGIVGLALNVATVVIVTMFLQSLVFGRSLLEGRTGCNLVEASSIISGSYLFLLSFELLVVCLTAYRAIEDLRGSRNMSLINLFYRDGILFFMCLVALSLAYILVSWLAPKEFLDLLWQITRVLHSIICCRIILNLRGAAAHQSDAVLHVLALDVALGMSDDSLDTSVAKYPPLRLDTHGLLGAV